MRTYHLQPNLDKSKSSIEIIVGRIDAKGTGVFYERYVAKDDYKKVTNAKIEPV